MSDAISAETFAPYVGRPVSLANGQALTLVAVDPHRSPRPNAAPQTSFSLILRGAAAPIVSEGLHRLAFEDGASFELYLIPIPQPSRRHRATTKTIKSSSIDRGKPAAPFSSAMERRLGGRCNSSARETACGFRAAVRPWIRASPWRLSGPRNCRCSPQASPLHSRSPLPR